MATHVTRNGIDSWVDSTAPAQNKAAGTWLRVLAPGAGTERSFLWLKSPPPANATIASCLLKLYQVGDWTGSTTVTVQRISARWVESTLNWNNQPGVTGASVSVTKTASSDRDEWVFDITALEQLIADGAPNYGYRIVTSSTTERKFNSLQAADHKPVKVTQWSDKPDVPGGLNPAAGSAVSVGHPVLSYDYHDPNASDLTAHRIQINATASIWTEAGGFAAPDFDTGVVGTDDPEYDTASGSWTGIAATTLLWWTVRVRNADGLWSDWADPVSFTRINKITAVLNNPAASPNNFVSDTTPEFFWTNSGGAQVARRVLLYDVTNAPDVDPNRPLWDTDRIHTGETSWTPPDGIIGDEDATYRVEVRVHDNDTRTTTPGDQVYISLVRDFTFREDPTPNPVTSLAAAQVASGRPNVRLSWNRATAPDAFSIWRGGKHIATVDPADAFVSGTSYAFIDNWVWPHTLHSWSVRCRVGGVLGPARTVAMAYETPVAWLIADEPGGTLLVPILTPDWNFDMDEIGASFDPIDGQHPIHITQGLQGLSGSVTGALRDWSGLHAADIVKTMLYMKARPEGVRRLILGAQNLPVIVYDVALPPLSGGNPDDRAVSFSFFAGGGPR